MPIVKSSLNVLFFLFKLQVFSLGVLIAALAAVQAINEVVEVFDSVNYDYDAESYQGAAGWLIFVACASIAT